MLSANLLFISLQSKAFETLLATFKIYFHSSLPVDFVPDDSKSACAGFFPETEDEGFHGGPRKSTTNIGWLVGTPRNPYRSDKSPHIDIYEAGQVKPPPYLNVKDVPDRPSGYCLSRSKSVCDLSIAQNSNLLSDCGSEKLFTIERKQVIGKNHYSAESEADMTAEDEPVGVSSSNQPHRSRVVRNRTILGSFPLFYKLSQSLSSLNTKSEVSGYLGSECATFLLNNGQSDR